MEKSILNILLLQEVSCCQLNRRVILYYYLFSYGDKSRDRLTNLYIQSSLISILLLLQSTEFFPSAIHFILF